MSYQALYRRYRPRRFADLIGQEHITTILKNQIQNAHASHAYLFCGSRGTGKTSTAKIFARAVNCISPEDGDACGRCEACLRMDESAVDIIEIDAASNNGVDDVRSLIEQARFTPLYFKYKVYIIDEVHMLTGAASNALLKTLEEPPAHVLFLLATTEPQKLLATVISRCQRYDFLRLSIGDIVTGMKSVLVQADAQVEHEGLLVIAKAADGGMRDALSLLDQCLAFCGKRVSLRDVYDVLGSMDTDFLFDIADSILRSDAKRMLAQLDEIVRSGRDLSVFAQDLSQHVRALLLAKTCGECSDLLECTQETMAHYIEQAKIATQERLLRALEQLANTQNEMKWLGKPRILLESALVRICRPEDESSLLALSDRVAMLEQQLKNGVPMHAQSAPDIRRQTAQETAPQKDAPPWEEEKIVPAKQYIKKNPEEEQAAVKAEKKTAVQAENPKGQAKKNTNSSVPQAEELWEKLKEAMKAANLSLYLMARHAQKLTLENGHLTAHFPTEKKNAVDMLNMPRNLDQLTKLLKELDENMTITIRLYSPVVLDEKAKELKRIFGDKLTIRD